MCEPEITEMLEYFSHDGDGVEGGGNDINMVDIMSEKEAADGVPEPESVHKGEGDKGVQSVHAGEGDLNKGDDGGVELPAEHDKGEDEVVEVNEVDGHDGGQSGKEVDVEKEVEADLEEGIESWNDSSPNDSSDDSQVGTTSLVDINVQGDVEDDHEELVGDIEVEVGVAVAQSAQQQNSHPLPSAQSSQQQNSHPLPSAQSSQQQNRPSQAPRHTAPIRPKLNARRGRIWKP
ncbi:hypothetical protein DEO72_LG8g1619 [Vigna unguiculata]|uniref:Uncharacterized protein n=1 Tax=Vigna unguiculata TaxID=3917 RepID=A0A4D6MS29_VIGUN|nr:hypothetical protein DEO72_LG8g1619 [Vigna unguiculata]